MFERSAKKYGNIVGVICLLSVVTEEINEKGGRSL